MLKVRFSGNYLQLEDARVIYRNFSGTAGKFNREGDRNFAVVIPDEETKDMLVEAGWNVKIKPPRDDFDEPFMFLPVKIKFNSRGPAAYVRSGDRAQRLNEETISILDEIDILSADMDLRPFDWDINGKTGRTAYLEAIDVIQRVDRFGARYAEENMLNE